MATDDKRLLREAVAAELRAAVARADLTQEQVAEKSGLSRVTVNRLLRALRSVDVEQLTALGEALDFEPGSLLDQARLKYLKQLAREDVQK
ncbi:helix-turn-helix domain-containing protein [Nocardia otitidiscaviarum]|uniref:helix-turn-helix domain-containing protein n=1 Tax=Nocardia otitidiscaviarum TaxID=1823 RepID=UPI0004A73D1E|nr:helix-turn-helix transcriptional regulator [Nocardia otitidiscaviarum]